MAAIRTTRGKGTEMKKMAANEAAATSQYSAPFKARRAILSSASTIMTMTADLMPRKSALMTGTLPKAA